MLYMATLAAVRHNPVLHAYYQRLLDRGVKIPLEDRPWVRGKATQVAVHGCIRYLDVLTDQKRSTEFCFLVRQQALLHGEHIELCSGLEFGVSAFSKEFETWGPITFK